MESSATAPTSSLRLRVGLLGWNRRRFRFSISLDRGEQEHAITPNNRRGTAPTGNFDFPLDVGLLVPLDGRITVRRDAVGLRSSPLVPVLLPLGLEVGRPDSTCHEPHTKCERDCLDHRFPHVCWKVRIGGRSFVSLYKADLTVWRMALRFQPQNSATDPFVVSKAPRCCYRARRPIRISASSRGLQWKFRNTLGFRCIPRTC